MAPHPLLKILGQPDRPTADPTAVDVRIRARSVEVESVGVVRVVRGRRPIVAARANKAHRRTATAATTRQRHDAQLLKGGELIRRVGVG